MRDVVSNCRACCSNGASLSLRAIARDRQLTGNEHKAAGLDHVAVMAAGRRHAVGIDLDGVGHC